VPAPDSEYANEDVRENVGRLGPVPVLALVFELTLSLAQLPRRAEAYDARDDTDGCERSSGEGERAVGVPRHEGCCGAGQRVGARGMPS
jgi:hypothetical protein